MRTIGYGVLTLAIAVAGSQAFAANRSFSTSSGPSPAGRRVQVVLIGTELDARTLDAIDREVREIYALLHPGHRSYRVRFGVDAEGKIEATALPYTVAGQGPSTQATGPQPPPPGGTVPDYGSRVDLHIVNFNGSNRDTSYGRDVAPDRHGVGFQAHGAIRSTTMCTKRREEDAAAAGAPANARARQSSSDLLVSRV